MLTNKYKVFAFFKNGNIILIKNFKLLPDNYIQVSKYEPVPIEDYGDYMFFKDDITEKEVFNLFLEKLC
jgi:hypothetical protein